MHEGKSLCFNPDLMASNKETDVSLKIVLTVRVQVSTENVPDVITRSVQLIASTS